MSLLDVAPIFCPVALVTGGSRGIGRGICIELAKVGFGVAINYRSRLADAETTSALCQSAGAPWTGVFPADVGITADREALLNNVLNATGRVDLLVNNAGITSPVRGDLLDIADENWEAVLAANLKGPFFLASIVAKQMIRQRTAGIGDRQTIVNITSVSAFAVSVNRGEYCISKAGLSMATKLLACRLAEENIAVFEVRPGVIDSDMTAPVKEKYDRLFAEGLTPIRRWGTPEDVGKAVAALATGALPYSTGEAVHIDGGFHMQRL